MFGVLFFGNNSFSQKTNLAGAFIVPEPAALWGGMKSRVGKYFKGRGRKGENGKGSALAEIIISFSPNVCEILRKRQKKILQPSAADLMFSHLSIPLSPYSFDYCIRVHSS